jgi:hypothetical protein
MLIILLKKYIEITITIEPNLNFSALYINHAQLENGNPKSGYRYIS